jgi:hypothetical protein
MPPGTLEADRNVPVLTSGSGPWGQGPGSCPPFQKFVPEGFCSLSHTSGLHWQLQEALENTTPSMTAPASDGLPPQLGPEMARGFPCGTKRVCNTF